MRLSWRMWVRMGRQWLVVLILRWLEIYGVGGAVLFLELHTRFADPAERHPRRRRAANLSVLRKNVSTISKIKDFTTRQYRNFRQFNMRLSKATLKYYPLVRVIPSCGDNCLARFESLAEFIFLLPLLVAISHFLLCLFVSHNIFKNLLVYLQDLLRGADFCLSLMTSMAISNDATGKTKQPLLLVLTSREHLDSAIANGQLGPMINLRS